MHVRVNPPHSPFRWPAVAAAAFVGAFAAGCESDRSGLQGIGKPTPVDSTRIDGGNTEPNKPPPPDKPDATATSDVVVPTMDVAGVADVPPDRTPGSTPICNFGRFLAKRVAPEILLVFDRSSAMRRPAAGSMQTRWVEMTDGVAEVLQAKQAAATWGLKLFPSTMACIVNDGVDVPVGSLGFSEVITKIRGSMPATGAEGSPVHQAILTALVGFPAAQKPRFIVLASDGLPGCPAGEPGELRAYEALRTAAMGGVRTFVIGTATAGTQQDKVLNELAVSGREARAGTTRYFPAQNKTQMVQALDAITEQVTSCTFSVTPAPPSPNWVYMDIAGMRVPRDQEQLEGWNYGADMRDGTKTVRIYGKACEKLRADPTAPVEMIFSCPDIVPP